MTCLIFGPGPQRAPGPWPRPQPEGCRGLSCTKGRRAADRPTSSESARARVTVTVTSRGTVLPVTPRLSYVQVTVQEVISRGVPSSRTVPSQATDSEFTRAAEAQAWQLEFVTLCASNPVGSRI